jgi:uncharacterized protein
VGELEMRHLWDQVPSAECKGLCVEACGPIDMSDVERKYLADKGIIIGHNFITLTCDKLKLGRCTIYEDRPLVCRLFGATPDMMCRFGCQPTMTAQQARDLFLAMLRVKPE